MMTLFVNSHPDLSLFFSPRLFWVTIFAIMFSWLARPSIFWKWLLIAVSPAFFLIVAYSELGAWVLIDGVRPYAKIHGYPSPDNFLCSYMALGTSYFIARRLTQMPDLSVRIIAWCEIALYVFTADWELYLVFDRVYLD